MNTQSQLLITKYIPLIQNWYNTYAFVKRIKKPTPEVWLPGKLAEVLVSYYLHGADLLDWSIYAEGNDSGTDLIYKGRKIDVKACRFFKDPLLKEYVKARGSKDDTVYCLVALDISKAKYKIFGFIEGKDFTTAKYLVDNWMGKGDRYIASTKDLNPYFFDNL
jgi:hypothetical protein